MSAVGNGWPEGPGPTVLVSDGWPANGGDAAITQAVVASLRRAVPGVRILVSAHHGELVGHHYPELTIVDPLDRLVDERTDLVASADAVVSQGGGFLFEHYAPGRRVAAHRRVMELGVPLAFWTQSVGWIDDPGLRAKIVACLDSARTVLARDEASARNVVALGALTRPEVTADEVLTLRGRSSTPASAIVGVTLNALPDSPADGRLRPPPPDVVDRHAALLERLLAGGGHVRALSTVQGWPAHRGEIEDDSAHHGDVVARLEPGSASRVEIVDDYLPPARFRALAAELDVLVTARMHAAMLAMLEGVPAVYACASFKGADLFRRLGLEELVVPDADAPAVERAVARARELRPTIPDRLARLRPVAARNATRVVHALGLAA